MQPFRCTVSHHNVHFLLYRSVQVILFSISTLSQIAGTSIHVYRPTYTDGDKCMRNAHFFQVEGRILLKF